MLRAVAADSKRSFTSLVIVSTPALHLKAAESFLETSQCTYEHNSVGVQENPDYEMWKEQISSGIGEEPD